MDSIYLKDYGCSTTFWQAKKDAIVPIWVWHRQILLCKFASNLINIQYENFYNTTYLSRSKYSREG